jgi:membrane protein EpsK
MNAVAQSAKTVGVSQRRGRFSVNLLANLGYLGVSMLVGVWYVPFLVKHLGAAAYGLVPLASTLTSYMSLITLGLNAAVGRSLTIALEQGDDRRANGIFNTSLWGSLALNVALLLPAGLGLVYLDKLIQVPAGYETQARWLFAGVVAAFLLNEVKTPFDVSSYCRNRFDLRNLVAVAEIFARVGLVLVLFNFLTPTIGYVGLAILCGTIVSMIGASYLWRALTPSLQVQLRAFDSGVLKELVSTGGWVIVIQLGAILYLGIDLVLANRLFGPEQSGKFAAVLQLPLLIRSVGSAIGGVFSPTVLYYYSRNDLDGLLTYLQRAVKCVGLMLALPIGLMCGFAEPLLRLWLGAGFAYLSPLLFLMAAHLCVNMAINPLLGLQVATNRVKTPGIVTLLMGLGNLGLALLLAGPMGWGLYGIAGAGAIMLTLKNVLFTPIYAAHVMGKPWISFLRELAPIVAVTGLTIAAGRAMALAWPMTGWIELGAAAMIISGAYGLAVLQWALSPEERAMFRKLLRRQPAQL